MIDLEEIAHGLGAGAAAAFAPPEWLRESWRRPEGFLAEVCAWHHAVAPLGSAPGRRYTLSHDLVARHADLESPALLWWEAGERREQSFAELAQVVAGRAAAWRAAGARPGQRVALVRDFSPELATSLLAALEVGLVFALVPPAERRLARLRLAALAPDFVDCDPLYAPLLPDGLVRLDAERRGAGEPARAHVYHPGEPAALLFDPAADDPLAPRALSADALFAGAALDGPLALGLRRGHLVAAPEQRILATQPALLLTTLFSGAGFACVSLEELALAPELLPELLAARPLQALGVGPALRELLQRQAPALGPRCATWFRDPLAAPRLEPWQDFVARAGLERSAALNLRFEAALGGCTLFSPARPGRAHCDVLPAPGRSWSLVDLVRDDAPALGPGRLGLTPPGAPEAVVTCAVVLPSGPGWLSGGALPARPRGRAYPAAHAVAVARSLDGVRDALVLLDPSAADAVSRAVLLVFTDGDAGGLRGALEERLALELGRDELPDQLLTLPLYPRRDESGAADARWCHQQLRSGGLARKSRDEFFRLLSQLRARVVSQDKEPA